MRTLINPETLDLLNYLEARIAIWRFHEVSPRRWRRADQQAPTLELATVRSRLLNVNYMLAELGEEGEQIYAEEDPIRFDWLTYLEECKVIPVYDDAIAVIRQRPLVEPQEVEHILRFIAVGGSNYGVDEAECHGHGYHFHFGKVKSNTLTRVNVVLTFDHRKPVPTDSHDPLFVEEHGSGRYKHMDIATVGKNVRYPVYKICEQELQSIGRQNFKSPAAKAGVFY